MERHGANMNTERVVDRHECCAADARGKRVPSWFGRTLLAVGISGASLAALCCAAPFLLAGLLGAIGLGFILNDAILMGLLILFVAVAALGYYFMQRAKRA